MNKIIGIPAFKDNYIWAIINPQTRQMAVVDPGDAAPVLTFLQHNDMQLTAILLTHHHADHIGGVPNLLKHAQVPVYGVTNPVTEGTVIELSEQWLQLKVLEIPAHTLDHVAYYNQEVLFCGDTLFTGGCGRVFEGTAAQMLAALDKLAALDPQTKVYCGHEYTVNNLRFAAVVEPHNSAIFARLAKAEALRAANWPTVPSTMAEELATNPFLRTKQPEVVASIQSHFGKQFTNQVETFAALREWKNSF